MDLDPSQLRALRTAVDEGTFEAAARILHVTPSAVSQRLKALESATGRLLVVRSKPIEVTAAGKPILRLARQLDLLTEEAARELRGGTAGSGRPTLRVAVNADSLATWALPALAPLAASMDVHISREDQDHTAQLLLDGSVMAAVTTQAQPMPGCTATRLGVMAYRPFATPEFANRWFPAGPTRQALAQAPMVVFDSKDDLQHAYLRRRSRVPLEPPRHQVPSSGEFLSAVRLGMGWGSIPDLQSRPLEQSGKLVAIDPDGRVPVMLYWQQWRLRFPSLDRLAEAIAAAARESLQRR